MLLIAKRASGQIHARPDITRASLPSLHGNGVWGLWNQGLTLAFGDHFAQTCPPIRFVTTDDAPKRRGRPPKSAASSLIDSGIADNEVLQDPPPKTKRKVVRRASSVLDSDPVDPLLLSKIDKNPNPIPMPPSHEPLVGVVADSCSAMSPKRKGVRRRKEPLINDFGVSPTVTSSSSSFSIGIPLSLSTMTSVPHQEQHDNVVEAVQERASLPTLTMKIENKVVPTTNSAGNLSNHVAHESSTPSKTTKKKAGATVDKPTPSIMSTEAESLTEVKSVSSDVSSPLSAPEVLLSPLTTPKYQQLTADTLHERTPQETIAPPGVTVVNDRASAERVLKLLYSEGIKERYHACDTETKDIDPKAQSPVGNGVVICASIYCGPDLDFGNGPAIWIDNLDGAEGVLDLFKEYFEDNSIKKVWHNYGFDRHVMCNWGIDCQGFAADTMQMARLWNSARAFEGGYSLEKLSRELCGDVAPKVSMADRFSYQKMKKDGTLSKITAIDSPPELQRNPAHRTDWVLYSAGDAKSTWHLRERLEEELKRWPWAGSLTMFDFYNKYWLPFGDMLTDMERAGIYVRRRDYLPKIHERAKEDMRKAAKAFIDWAQTVRPEAKYMNPCSETQKSQFFFAPPNETVGDVHQSNLPVTRAFEALNDIGYIEPGKTRPKKNITFHLGGLGMPVRSRTPKGAPQAGMPVLKEMAGRPLDNPPKYGAAYEFFGGGDAGKRACEAINSLVQLSAVEIMITTFIEPLQLLPDENDRVHCSLGFNTETGRLSARRPNLQNQPALEKDVYRVRDAFAAPPGKKLIVADYGQLELRILAHITKCTSMIEAFKLGGDFHSRTAMGMYPKIAEDVSNGKVLLEWDYSQGKPTLPLLKDQYASERRKAKILNFSIAYGKTASGLAKDFDVSAKEAKEIVNLWFRDRPEVLEWQQKTIADARKTGVTRTLMGRYRPLNGINDPKGALRGHMERAAINTPIQGGAADVVMAGMLKLHRNERLRHLGWRVLMQIHDELIVEGPEESADEALEIVREGMCHPFKQDLLVDLVVDASIASTWFEGK